MARSWLGHMPGMASLWPGSVAMGGKRARRLRRVGYATTGVDVHIVVVLDDPTSSLKGLVDALAGPLLRGEGTP